MQLMLRSLTWNKCKQITLTGVMYHEWKYKDLCQQHGAPPSASHRIVFVDSRFRYTPCSLRWRLVEWAGIPTNGRRYN
ncbi:hypothetical protein EMIT0196P_20117 [Pseudomonas chlororaphis]